MSSTTASVLWLGLILCVSVATAAIANETAKANLRRFPDDFQFGSATASYQVEGAWNEDGKSESIWDYLTHKTPCITKDCKNGDVATDSYHQYQRDVEMMRELGLDYYRFSLSWTRILPSGFPNEINYAGVQYYNNLIDEMLKYNIQPMITLYHWDLPQRLQELGGLTNPYFVDWYADYARVAYGLFGDRVKLWITINEPLQICDGGYGATDFAPVLNFQGIAEYMCSRNVMLAHARAWHIYNDEFRPTQQGEAGISINVEWYEPLTDSVDDHEAAHDVRQFEWGQYIHPIFSATGDYPAELKQRVAVRSAEQGFPRSRLQEFTPAEVEYIRGTADFLGINTYSTKFVYRNETTRNMHNSPSYWDDLNAATLMNSEYPQGSTAWMQVIPWGFYALLTHVKDSYGNPKVYVTESGYASWGGLEDDDRVDMYRGYMNALLDAIDYGCNVKKYTAWSIMDNFEWLSGYTAKFGLYEVDFDDPNRKRTARKSALVFKEIIKSRVIDLDYLPTNLDISVDVGH